MDDAAEIVQISGWSFCAVHLLEVCDQCVVDLRSEHNRVLVKPCLITAGWPDDKVTEVLAYDLNEHRRPALRLVDHAIKTGAQKRVGVELLDTYQCKQHKALDCKPCFDFAAHLIRDAGLMPEHTVFLKTKSRPVPPAALQSPSTLFFRRFPRYRGLPSIKFPAQVPEKHTLSLTYPYVRSIIQLPPYHYTPLGWTLFATVVAPPGPLLEYAIKDQAGNTAVLRVTHQQATVPLKQLNGKPAAKMTRIKEGSLLSIKCATMRPPEAGETKPNVILEADDLIGLKVLKPKKGVSFAGLQAVNVLLSQENRKKCSMCTRAYNTLECSKCRTVYCGSDCQGKDWERPNGHKRSCKTIEHLRTLNLQFSGEIQQ